MVGFNRDAVGPPAKGDERGWNKYCETQTDRLRAQGLALGQALSNLDQRRATMDDAAYQRARRDMLHEREQLEQQWNTLRRNAPPSASISTDSTARSRRRSCPRV